FEAALATGMRTGQGDEWLELGHVKFFTDGALGSQTAALEEPYEGTQDRGILTFDPIELRTDVARAAAGGLSVAIHAIGDRAVHAFGSDAPVEPIDPLLGIHAAVARRRPGDGDAWFPAQRLTLDEALHGYTAGAAYSTGREREWGTLEVGKRCDATVVDRDLAKLNESELLEAQVRATITDGVVRYADGLA